MAEVNTLLRANVSAVDAASAVCEIWGGGIGNNTYTYSCSTWRMLAHTVIRLLICSRGCACLVMVDDMLSHLVELFLYLLVIAGY